MNPGYVIMIYLEHGATLTIPGSDGELARISGTLESAWEQGRHGWVKGTAYLQGKPWHWQFWTGAVTLLHTALLPPEGVATTGGAPQQGSVPPGMNPAGYQRR